MRHFGYVAVACFAFVSALNADTVTLDFDSVSAPPCCSVQVDATNYLSSFGITFVPLTPGSTPVIANGTPFGPGESAAIPVSLPNYFAVNAAPGQSLAPLSYELEFSQPVTSVSFYRTGIISISTGPAWTASALNPQGQVLDSVGEGRTVGPSAELFTLTGIDITALRIDAQNDLATFTDPPIDNLTLVYQSTAAPEPTTVLMIGFGLFGVALRRRFLHAFRGK